MSSVVHRRDSRSVHHRTLTMLRCRHHMQRVMAEILEADVRLSTFRILIRTDFALLVAIACHPLVPLGAARRVGRRTQPLRKGASDLLL